MSDFRRYFVPGGSYFFTVVTYGRRKILTEGLGRLHLHNAFIKIKRKYPFQQLACCLLPEHLHAIWVLPSGDADYSTRWKRIKEEFTQTWLAAGGSEASVTPSQKKRGQRGVWQPRFWEHTLRDETDLETHFDYIHWNPRKHGLVKRVRDWPWSTFHKHVRLGHDDIDWGGTEPTHLSEVESFGEPGEW